MFNTILSKIPHYQRLYKFTSYRYQVSNNLIIVIFYVTAFSTLSGGILHLLMIGPTLKPVNFPMDMLPYTDGLFIVSGILQIFWVIPMIMRWGYKWYLTGLIGTIGLSVLLLITRIPNGITGLPLEDRNPMALLTELSQFVYIGSTLMVIMHSRYHNTMSLRLESRDGLESKSTKLYYKGNEKKIILKAYTHGKDGNSEDTFYLIKKLEFRININSRDSRLWIARGIALRQLGGNYEAIQSFDEAIRLDPTEVAAWYQKGLTLNILGKKKEARQIYEIAKLIKRCSQSQDSRKPIA